jgi:SAM-dependent methyltransferase
MKQSKMADQVAVAETASARCPLCSSEGRPQWARTYFYACVGCGLIFRWPLPRDDELSRLYEESWSDPCSCGLKETGGTDLAYARMYARKLATELGVKDLAGLEVCDFGAGRGEMASALAELGARVFVVEPFGQDYLRSHGFEPYGSLGDLPPDLRFDGVVSISVMEHLAAPWRVLADIRARLKPNAWAYLATPNAGGLAARLTRHNWSRVRERGHLLLFAPATMSLAMDRAGFTEHRRLRWFIPYHKGLRNSLLYALQTVGLDGELRYLAFNR